MPQCYEDALNESFIPKALFMSIICFGELPNGAGALSTMRKGIISITAASGVV